MQEKKYLSLLMERLQNLYDRAINFVNKRHFFLALFEYLEVFDEENLLKPVIKQIVTKGKKDNKKIATLENQALKELRETYVQVRSYVKKNKAIGRDVIYELDQFARLEKGAKDSRGPLVGRYDRLSYALMLLVEYGETKHLPFVCKYGKVTDKRKIQEWVFSPSYEKWEQEIAYLNRIKLTKVWYSWDKLAFFYNLYRNYEKMQKANFRKKDLFGLYNLNYFFCELKDILKNGKPDPECHEFKEEEYKGHLQRVHLFVKQALSCPEKSIVESTDHTYKVKDNILIVDDKEIIFRVDKIRISLLKELAKKRGYTYFSEIKKIIEGAEAGTGRNVRNSCYEACRGIEARLAKSGIKSFIDYSFDKARINPNYQKLRK